MQVFKTYFRIAKKQLHGALIYIVIFAAIMFMMSSFSSEEASTRFQSSSLYITVIDEDQTEASEALISYLESIHNIVELPDDTQETLFDSLYYGKISYVLTIPSGYSGRLSDLNTEELITGSKLNNSARGYFIDQQISEYLNNVTLYLSGGYTLTEALTKTAAAFEGEPEVDLIDFDTKTETAVNSMMVYFFQFFPYIFLSVLILGMCPILIVFHQKELRCRIQCSSLSQRSKNLQLTMGCIVYTFLLWLLFMLAALVFYGPSDLLSHQGLLLIGNSAAFLPVGVAITLLLGTLISSNNKNNTTNVLNMVANVIGLGMSFLCGIFVPQYLLGDAVLAIAHFLPAYWYVRNSNMIGGFSGEAMSYSTYWTGIGIQLLFFAALFAIYLVAARQKKQKQLS